MKWIKKLHKALKMELREHKSSFRVYIVLRIFVIGLMCFQFANHNWESGFLCILTLILLILPSLVQVTLKIEFPIVLEIILLLFVFAAEILGEINEFYIIFPFWDTLLHTLNGFLMAAIGLSLVNLLNKSEVLTFSLSPLFTAIVAFCFSMTIGVIWEIFEFSMDQLFLLDMQKDTVIQNISSVTFDPTGGNTPYKISNIAKVIVNDMELKLDGYLDIGLIDTMHDLIVNLVGAIIFSVIGFFYIKNKDEKSIVGQFIPRRKSWDRDFWKQVNKGELEKHERNKN